ncbi:MAG: carbon-phosphorus lyase complex subunit PhnI [Slackia sp.]|nr:carbon-phosphorus lyase complex subunit PhnI [Slackia sp.]
MGYVAVRGGGRAIEESLALFELERVEAASSPTISAVASCFPDAIDQVMGESSLYAPELAALAFKQARGSIEEAVFLLRAFRSTLERTSETCVVDMQDMDVDRRISAAFKDVPGGQILGATRDYSHRLLDFSLADESDDDIGQAAVRLRAHFDAVARDGSSSGRLPKVLDYLREEGLIASCDDDDTPPADVTMGSLEFPCARSARLQTLARGMTQAVEALGYAAIRGYGPAHPTVGELRGGTVDLYVDDSGAQGESDPFDAYCLGAIRVCEVESVFEMETETDASQDSALSFGIGYGLVMGRAETKAIAMSVRYPTQDEEFVLYHVDGVEAQGFISHLKLPHYVTFQSKLDAVRTAAERQGNAAVV